MLLRCSNCGGYLEESELVRVQVSRKVWYMCPDCLESYCEDMEGTIDEVPADEEKEVREEWRADEEYAAFKEETI